MALNGAWRAIIRANGGGPGKVAEGAYHLVVCLTARGKVVSSPQRPASAPKNPTLRRSSNMRTTLASRRGLFPARLRNKRFPIVGEAFCASGCGYRILWGAFTQPG